MRLLANKAGLKSMILNRVGDFGLLLGFISLYYFFGTVDYSVIFMLIGYMCDLHFLFLNFQINILSYISILIFIGVMSKSAQFGLHS
jgi:NADH-quinone oxidoreductase subunit L